MSLDHVSTEFAAFPAVTPRRYRRSSPACSLHTVSLTRLSSRYVFPQTRALTSSFSESSRRESTSSRSKMVSKLDCVVFCGSSTYPLFVLLRHALQDLQPFHRKPPR
ncbi:hypothetical protein Bca4012_016964 [Brassica carinata]|uniref:Uncharacterized protein n=1 Tax=Brassica carinata TaxID=52824 RepID=A0A8X7WNB7_BRACI|nr:hypothetical protein Bca52824_004571 [Brassica carinata]